jgi:predicted GNAT family acetyltransferase
MRVVRYSAAADFLDAAGRWLLESEAENNVVIGLASAMAAGERDGKGAYFAVAFDEQSRAAACALRTPPYKLLVTRGVADALHALARDAWQAFPDLPAVTGPETAAQTFAEAWAELSRGRHTVGTRQRLYLLDAVRLPEAPPPGHLRQATNSERELAIEWLNAFGEEALPNEPRDAAGSVDRWLRQQLLHVWEDRTPVSMLTISGATSNGARIGMVYTPPVQRGRGYASAAVAALSAALLAQGHRYCCLYTDLSNPTSNSIYQKVGYRPYCDFNDYVFSAS